MTRTWSLKVFPRAVADYVRQIKIFSIISGSSVYGQLNEKLVQLQNEFEACSSPTVQNAIRELISDQQNDFDINKQKVDKISTGLDQEPSIRDPIQAQSDILMLKISIIKDVTNWRSRLSKFFELKKKEDKVFAKTNSKIRIASGSTAGKIYLLTVTVF